MIFIKKEFVKKIILTETQYRNLMYGKLNEDLPTENSVLEKYLKNKPELIPLYKQIEKSLGDKFTDDHFMKEIQYSGPLKNENGGLTPETIKNFKLMVKQIGLTGAKYSDQSYRDYNLQKDTFLKYAREKGGTISNGLKQAALPGFSQHHTGKALDFKPYQSVSDGTLKKFGFIRPYKIDTGFRMPEPWHILFIK